MSHTPFITVWPVADAAALAFADALLDEDDVGVALAVDVVMLHQ